MAVVLLLLLLLPEEAAMMTSVKHRVFAAEQIRVERHPTVSMVRAAAGFSNADAPRYLKEWKEESSAPGDRWP